MKKLLLLTALGMALFAHAGDLQIRPKNFIVTPSTGPVSEIIVKNSSESPYTGTVCPVYPEGWQVAPASQPVELAAGETKILSFAVEKCMDRKANVYPISITADQADPIETEIVCASTPYYKPKIDGSLDEWADSYPVTFLTDGKKTIVRSYWNKAEFCLAIDVEEDALIGLKQASTEAGLDAIQFALSPGKSTTATDPSAASVRYEYLAAASGSRWKGDKCFQLLTPGDELSIAQEARKLSPLVMEEALVKVKRSDGITRYEISVPLKPMKKALKVTAGREYFFSLLVHDPDGTGVRDLGVVMNCWDESRNPLAWSNWNQAKWGETRPFDNKIEFGFCSSIH
jgi:hypothetical protein